MGARFGNYELLEKIAVGGMAEIYLARSVRDKGIEKRMVIKRIHPTLSNDKSFVAMFIDEARLGVGMVHGNIVPVFDFGYVDGYYFLAMEHVVGQNLAELHAKACLVDMPWPVELAIYTTMEILEGLDYAHKKRDDQGRPLELVHRDVSPSNILISNDGQVKLLDFGIARSLAREYETRTGVIKGKPGYMSPEQAAGQAVDARADVWSAGSVLYELLQGKKLKDGRKNLEDSQLETLLDKALAANRDQRFGSAREFQTALADYLAARKLRPNSPDLSDFIHKVAEADIPGENWDLRSDSMEKHVAKALAQELGQIDHDAKTAPITNQPHRAAPPPFARDEPQTKRLWKEPSTDAARDSSKPAGSDGVSARATANSRFRWVGLLLLGVMLILAIFALRSRQDHSQSNPTGEEEGRPKQVLDKSPTLPQTLSQRVPSTVFLPISSQPAGAKLQLADRDTGKTTPTTLALPPGVHKIALTHPGFAKWEKIVELTEQEPAPLEATLVPEQSSFRVETNPTGAYVLVDGVFRGKSPISLTDLPPGKHRVAARLKGRTSVRRTVELQGQGEEKLVLTLLPPKTINGNSEPEEPGFLSVNTVPWTHVTLDGKMIGTTPIMNVEIPAGSHTILLTNPVRNLSRRLEIDLKPGEKRRIREILGHQADK